jgi:acylphosphatase
MVDRIFYIKEESGSIFDTDLRAKAKRFHVKIDTANIEEEHKVQVLASGNSEDVKAFHEYLKENTRHLKPLVMYEVTDLEVYKGQKILIGIT